MTKGTPLPCGEGEAFCAARTGGPCVPNPDHLSAQSANNPKIVSPEPSCPCGIPLHEARSITALKAEPKSFSGEAMLTKYWSDAGVLELQKRLGLCLPHVIGHLEAFLKCAFENLPRSGRLSNKHIAHVETWAQWCGGKGKLRIAMVRAGILVKAKRCYLVRDFSIQAPEYVRKRWFRKHLQSQKASDAVPTCTDNGGLQSTEQNRPTQPCPTMPSRDKASQAKESRDKKRAEQARQDKASPEQTNQGAPAQRPAMVPPPSPAGAPSLPAQDARKLPAQTDSAAQGARVACSGLAGKAVKEVSGEKEVPPVAPQAPDPLPESYDKCTDAGQRLRLALSRQPPEHPFMVLVASGMDALVARDLTHTHKPERIRQVAVYAAKHSSRNPAGLIRKCLENPDWGRK